VIPSAKDAQPGIKATSRRSVTATKITNTETTISPMSQSQMMIVATLAGLALAGLGFVWWRHRRLTLWQLILWYTAKLLVRFLWRAKQPPSFPLKPGQGAVIICNHRSSIDPFFIQTMADWPLHFMVAREYCQHWLLGFLLRSCEVIPTGRGGIDTASTRAALRYTASGQTAGMLPEGRINTTEEFMLPVRPGAVVVALKSRVPILPCYLEGVPYGGTALSPFFMFARVRVHFGDLIDFSEYYGREDEDGLIGELTLKAVSEIARLAGRDDFRPTLAGRKWRPA
jgi:1-acyl-sn-glycerol-3-phosphate acyltransferase